MNRLAYEIIFAIGMIISWYCFFNNLKCTHRLRDNLVHLSMAVSIAITAHFAMLVSSQYSYEWVKLTYTGYFSGITLCTGSFLIFAVDFCYPQFLKDRDRKLGWVSVVFLAICNLGNIFWENIIEYKEVYVGNERYYDFVPQNIFFVYLFLDVAFAFLGAACMIQKAIATKNMYRFQYVAITLAFSLVFVTNGIFMFTESPADFSIVIFALLILAITIYVNKIVETRELTTMAAALADGMNACILMYDSTGKLVYQNQYSRYWNRGQEEMPKPKIWKMLGLGKATAEEQKQLVHYDDEAGNRRHLEVKYRQLEDIGSEKGVFGTYLLIEDITAKYEENLRNEYKARHDELTGLLNRDYFCMKVLGHIKRNWNQNFALLACDIYQFKVINEIFGREAGDELIKKCAKRISEHTGVVAARVDADKLIACMPREKCTAEFLQEEGLFESVDYQGFKMRLYFGVCELSPSDIDIDMMVDRAFEAADAIKGKEDQRVGYYDSHMLENYKRELHIKEIFPKALEENRIKIFIQPQVNQLNGKIVGGEALVRWIDPEGKIHNPGEFVPLLTKTGAITHLDKRVWELTAAQIKRMEDMGIPTPLSMNLTAQDFYRFDLEEELSKLVEKNGIDPSMLRLEITESEVMLDMDNQIKLMNRMQKKGFVFEMDDFGSGYSSLNTLKDLPVNVLKMDMRFFENTGDKRKADIVIKNTINLAKDLDMPVIAEGVETKEQAEYLKDNNCNYIQGYYFGRPMPVEEFEALRKERGLDDMKVN